MANSNEKSRYKTKQKQIILSFIKSLNDKSVSIHQISRYLEEKGTYVGTSTIYRYLDQLVKAGDVKKYYIGNERTAYFRYIGEDKKNDGQVFYLKCEICNSLVNFKCSRLQNIQEHLLEEHDFNINYINTVFYGKCSKCV